MTISNTDNTIYSTDVIERIEELKGEFIDATNSDPAEIMSVDDWKFGLSDDDAGELVVLLEFAEQGSQAPDWGYGELFIHESYFTDYVEELARDIGAVGDHEGNNWVVIDWEATAENVRMDYSEAEFDGETYLYRA